MPLTILFCLLYKTWRLHVAVHLFCNRSQILSKCGSSTSDTYLTSCVPLLCSLIYYWTDAQEQGIYLLYSLDNVNLGRKGAVKSSGQVSSGLWLTMFCWLLINAGWLDQLWEEKKGMRQFKNTSFVSKRCVQCPIFKHLFKF